MGPFSELIPPENQQLFELHYVVEVGMPPSQDLQGAYTRIQQRLSAWATSYSARRQGEALMRETRHDG